MKQPPTRGKHARIRAFNQIVDALKELNRTDKRILSDTLGILFAKTILPLIALAFLTSCGTGNFQSLASNALAQSAITNVARYYGGDDAGALASAGLSATADVLQGYVDKKPPLEIAANSPGVKGVSQIVVDYLKTKGWVTQETVDSLHSAAQIASNATEKRSTVNDGP